MKYKVGDKVKVRKDLVVDTTYDGLAFIEEMKETLGKEVTIKNIHTCGDYSIQENGYFYTEEMFEGGEINMKNNEEVYNKGIYDDKVLEALKLLKNICKQHPNGCENCPFYCNNTMGYCLIQENSPSDWELNLEKEIKYFK